ncbi:MAG TPA: FMN-binding protein [Pseudonocardiaceae bacterium]
MKRVCAVLALTIAGLIPLLRYQPSTSAQAGTTVHASAPAQAGAAVSPQVGTATPATSSTPAPSIPAPSRQKTVDGSTVDTEFGPYQVQVVFTGNTITGVQLITEPSDRHSRRIADNAAPTLREETLQAQSANIDTVSGATATSEAYAQSLQAAIDGKGS